MNLAVELCPGLVQIIIKYKAKSALFSNYMFDAADNMMEKSKKDVLSIISEESVLKNQKWTIL